MQETLSRSHASSSSSGSSDRILCRQARGWVGINERVVRETERPLDRAETHQHDSHECVESCEKLPFLLFQSIAAPAPTSRMLPVRTSPLSIKTTHKSDPLSLSLSPNVTKT